MKHCWVSILLLGVGCAIHPDQDGDEKWKEKLESGAVVNVAFTGDGKYCVAVNFRKAGRSSHCCLRSFSTRDWKPTADTGKLYMDYLGFAFCAGNSWLFQAEALDRFGKGNPILGPEFYQFHPVTLERKSVDLIQKGLDNIDYKPSALACADNRLLYAVHLTRFNGESPYPAFIFDVKSGKKTIELQDFPTGERTGDFPKTVLEFTPDGKHIASCQPCPPFQLQLHAADTGKLVKSLKLDSPAGAMKFSPNGKMLAALCRNGAVLILEPDLAKRIHTLKVQKHPDGWGWMPDGVAFAGNEHLAVVSGSVQVELFDTKDWKTVHTFGKEERKMIDDVRVINAINCVAGSPDGKWVAVGSGKTRFFPGKIRVFEVKTGKTVVELD